MSGLDFFIDIKHNVFTYLITVFLNNSLKCIPCHSRGEIICVFRIRRNNMKVDYAPSGKRLSLFVVVVLVTAGMASAQDTTLKLSTTDNTSSFDVTKSDDATVMSVQADGKVGINNDSPATNLYVDGTEGVMAVGTDGVGTALNPGAGVRLHWYPKKASFRAGSVDGTQWNDANIGEYSVAFGASTIASGNFSTATGYLNTASGDYSMALGSGSTAEGDASTAIGPQASASGSGAVAIGSVATATGNASTAMGFTTTASGDYSTALGMYVSTNNQAGSFIIGDATMTTANCDAVNQMVMRFSNGYKLYTNGAATVGAEIVAGGNSWSSISDSTKKENYLPADGEAFLKSLSTLRLGSWNYKGQNPAENRHYGPMAQEIFANYGHDGVGVVGCDTLLASADMDGIMMICLKALEKRTSELNEAKEQMTALEETIRQQGEAIASMQTMIAAMEEKLNAVAAITSVEQTKQNKKVNPESTSAKANNKMLAKVK